MSNSTGQHTLSFTSRTRRQVGGTALESSTHQLQDNNPVQLSSSKPASFRDWQCLWLYRGASKQLNTLVIEGATPSQGMKDRVNNAPLCKM